MAKKYSETHDIVYYQCDTNGTLTLPTLLNIIIKTSSAQSDALNRGSDYVASFGLAWVITQYDIAITRLPSSGETVTVTTQATSYNKFFCYRNFWVHDEAGNECVFIKSTFVLMNIENRKMSSVIEDIIAPYESEKVKRIERGEKIQPVENGRSQDYRVRFLDIDGNKHVNNSKYLDWMTDVLGFDFLTSHTPERVLIKFDKEVEYGEIVDSIWSLKKQDGRPAVSCHQIKVNDTICAEATIFWQIKNE